VQVYSARELTRRDAMTPVILQHALAWSWE